MSLAFPFWVRKAFRRVTRGIIKIKTSKILKEFKKNKTKTLIATDFDGTISVIKNDHTQVTIDQEIKNLLQKLQTNRYLVAVISGRNVRQLAKLVGLRNIYYVGNHGAEYLTNSKYHVNRTALRTASIIKHIFEELTPYSKQNYLLDFKKYSLAIHYRNHPHPKQAQNILDNLFSKYNGRKLKIAKGRMVYDISTKGVDKGTAVKHLISEFCLKQFLYVGDDRTDLDAFNALKGLPERGVNTVCVALASSESPPELLASADIVLNSHKKLKDLFKNLLNIL